jgi:hypothetical protein
MAHANPEDQAFRPKPPKAWRGLSLRARLRIAISGLGHGAKGRKKAERLGLSMEPIERLTGPRQAKIEGTKK